MSKRHWLFTNEDNIHNRYPYDQHWVKKVLKGRAAQKRAAKSRKRNYAIKTKRSHNQTKAAKARKAQAGQ